MPLTPGSRLGPYQILAPIGAGGMGEVYKARDTRLDRTVAVKVSTEHFSERFEREARAVAALNHPHICTLHDVGPDYLVMEFIDGAPLQGPLPLGQALNYAAQICAALDAAHCKGIVHRDLKPANILVTKSGIKLLDFGLAKMGLPVSAPSAATMTMALTGKNEIVGTLYYMSPEQLQAQGTGKEIDARSDIFSFGLVLYEMLTGKRAFEGASPASVIAAIMERPAPSLASNAPPPLDRALQRCLAKDPEERWQSARDLRAELEWIASAPAAVSGGATAAARSPRLAWVAVGVLAVVAAGTSRIAWRGANAAPDRLMVQLDLDTGPDGVLDPAISPDGSRVAFVAQAANGSHLAMRRLDQNRISVLADTQSARLPFFSPDGRSLGFFEIGKRAKLKVLSLDGGAATALADAEYPGGASWSDDGTIAATLNQWATGIVHRIPAAGGSPQPLTVRDLGSEHVSPQYLPGGKALLFTRKRLVAGYTYEICAATPRGKPKVLVANASGARYLESGHLVFFRQGRIYAVRFDPGRLELIGEAIPMVEGVADQDGISPLSLSSAGDLVYLKGRTPQRIVVRIDAYGAETKVIDTPGAFVMPRISPDGKRLAIVDLGAGDGRILIHDLTRGVTNRLTLDERPQGHPAWTADGQHIVYSSGDTLLWARADGAGQPEALTPGKKVLEVAFSRDGRLAAFNSARSQGGGYEIWISRVENRGGKPGFGDPVLLGGGASTQTEQTEPAFSPDGRWLAYMSNETGVYQIYVVSLTVDGHPAGGKWQVSDMTGYNPHWPSTGEQLFFEGHQSGFYVAPYSTKGDSFASEPPRSWGQRRSSYYEGVMADVTPDGKQVIAVVDAEASARETHIRMILHFGDEIRRRLAGRAK